MTAPATADGHRPADGRAYLDVRDLRVHFPTDDGLVRAVDGLSFSIERGRTLAIVGESGSGKSVTSLAVLGLHKGTRARLSGEIWLGDQELVSADKEAVRALRGDQMAMIFQDPLSALHPFYKVGAQIAEAYRVHHAVPKKVARERAVEMLDRVGIPNARSRAESYPHEFSGGMRQRAMIAMALVNDPQLLIADEPTTALDVTVQAQILDLVRDLQEEFGSAVLMITHDLGVVAELADDVLVMYAGQAVETGSVDDVFYRPEHPYTWGLLSSVPRLDRERTERLVPIPGSPPSLVDVPSGCAFRPRCGFREVPGQRAVDERPLLVATAGGHGVACHMDPAERRRLFEEQIKPRL